MKRAWHVKLIPSAGEVLKVRNSRQGTDRGRGFRNLTPSLRATARAVFAGISSQQEL